jgi:hypothetical protein
MHDRGYAARNVFRRVPILLAGAWRAFVFSQGNVLVLVFTQGNSCWTLCIHECKLVSMIFRIHEQKSSNEANRQTADT